MELSVVTCMVTLFMLLYLIGRVADLQQDLNNVRDQHHKDMRYVEWWLRSQEERKADKPELESAEDAWEDG